MNYPEKTIARQFYNNLNDAFGQGGKFLPKFFQRKIADVFISIEGAGVHWSFKLEKDNRKCSIACFHYDFPHKKGPEYYIEFINDKSVLATGRTSNRKFVLNAIKDWMDGKTLPGYHIKRKTTIPIKSFHEVRLLWNRLHWLYSEQKD